MERLQAIWRALRPVHWAKNALVFLPVATAHRGDWDAWSAALLAFVVFSLAASAVYLANDVADRAADRAHPRKRERPVASGALPSGAALALAAGLAAGSVALGLAVTPALAVLVGIYLLLAAGYSAWLKRVAWVDLLCLAAFHVVRVVAGGVATGIVVSRWLLLVSACLFLALGALKRLSELVDARARELEQVPGRGYASSDARRVDLLFLCAAAGTIAVLGFYVASPQVSFLYQSNGWVWLLCPIVGGWLWHLYRRTLTGRMGDDPLVFALTDPVSLACGAALPLVLWLAA